MIVHLHTLPTQFITEFIKSNGYAGVAYTSTMRTEGINVAVFDESIFECVAVHTVEINNISYSYEKIDIWTAEITYLKNGAHL